MAKKIKARVEEALTDKVNHEYAKGYLEALQSTMQKTESRFQKTTLLVFFMFVMFELLVSASISEVTIGPFKVNDFTIIQKLLPVVIAYLYYELASFASMLRIQAVAYGHVVGTICSPFYENSLHLLVMAGSTFDIEEILAENTEGTIKKLIGNLSTPLKLAIIFAPFLFAGYAFYRCFSIFGVTDVLVWISLVISLLFLLQGFLIFLNTDKVA